jgi:hypothetical protein
MPALLVAIQGLFVGLVALLPMYLLRAMGAGDVKLMGLVGVFLGPLHVLGATLSILLVGGVLALVFAIHGNKLHSVLGKCEGNSFRSNVQAFSATTAYIKYKQFDSREFTLRSGNRFRNVSLSALARCNLVGCEFIKISLVYKRNIPSH